MIKNIINSFNSGFFRTLGRLCLYILLGYILLSFYSPSDIKIKLPLSLGFTNVYAADSGLWVQDTLHIEEADFYNWSSASSYSHLTTHQDSYYFYTNQSIQNSVGDILDYRQIYFTNTMNLGSNGVSFVLKMPSQLTSNVLYNVNLYMCTRSVAPAPYSVGIRAGSSYTNSLTAGYNYSSLTRISIGSAYFADSNASTTWPNCYLYSGFIDTKQSGAYVNFRLTGNANGEHAIIGITYQSVGLTNGLTSQDVSNVISSSGLASATSVSQVQSSVNQVQQELEDVNGSIEEQTQQQQENHEETINTITDDTVNPNIYDFGDLPVASDTPITDLLLLPMNLINSLLSSLNNSCTTYQLPFFNNTTLNLPCINISNYLGADLWHIIDLCIVFYMVYNLFMLFISIFDDITSLKDGFSSLYVPRHAGHTRVSRANMEGLY